MRHIFENDEARRTGKTLRFPACFFPDTIVKNIYLKMWVSIPWHKKHCWLLDILLNPCIMIKITIGSLLQRSFVKNHFRHFTMFWSQIVLHKSNYILYYSKYKNTIILLIILYYFRDPVSRVADRGVVEGFLSGGSSDHGSWRYPCCGREETHVRWFFHENSAVQIIQSFSIVKTQLKVYLTL